MDNSGRKLSNYYLWLSRYLKEKHRKPADFYIFMSQKVSDTRYTLRNVSAQFSFRHRQCLYTIFAKVTSFKCEHGGFISAHWSCYQVVRNKSQKRMYELRETGELVLFHWTKRKSIGEIAAALKKRLAEDWQQNSVNYSRTIWFSIFQIVCTVSSSTWDTNLTRRELS
jgi:hypothetical protein